MALLLPQQGRQQQATRFFWQNWECENTWHRKFCRKKFMIDKARTSFHLALHCLWYTRGNIPSNRLTLWTTIINTSQIAAPISFGNNTSKNSTATELNLLRSSSLWSPKSSSWIQQRDQRFQMFWRTPGWSKKLRRGRKWSTRCSAG